MKIVVLAGGISTERDVSLVTGAMIYRALKEKQHQPVLLDVYLGYEGESIIFLRRRRTGVKTSAQSRSRILTLTK